MTTDQTQPFGWVKVGILGAVLFVCFAAIAVLGYQVNQKISEQTTASSDNVQWVLSQLEIDFLNLQIAINDVEAPEDVKDVKRKFDILYSRVDIFETSSLYSPLRSDLGFAQRLAGVGSELDALIPTIDSSETDLYAALPELSTRLARLSAPLRQMGLIGIDFFVKASDRSRAEIWLTLMRVAALTMALVMTLIILVVVMFQLYRMAQTNAEETSAASARLNAMVSSTLDAVIVVNEAGRIVEFNGSAEEIFGYTRKEAIGAPLVDLIIPLKYRKRHLEGMRRHLKDGTTNIVDQGRVQMDALRKNGELFPCEFSIARAETKQGILLVAFLRDNSAQVAAEKDLLRARDEALAGERTKAEFMAVMSHEMRTPLNGMLGTMELLRDTTLDERQSSFLQIMETSGRLLLHHVNDVLDIARLDAGRTDAEKRPFVLDELIQQIVDSQRSIAHANQSELEVDITSLGHPTVLGDEQRLRQVLFNLVSNAIKFTEGGVVRIEAEQLADSDLMEFRVIDTGIGIDEDDIDRIFEDFVTLDTSYSRRFGGTGLGLGIAKRLVESMDGAIGVESEVGDGSLFWFRIPLPILSNKAEPKTETSASPSHAHPLDAESGLEVLVVEDNQINQLVVQEMLVKEGHTVSLANDGQEGVSAAALRRFDVILMDISMPRMDGVAACHAIRDGDGRSRDTRIIALTANALPEDIERFKQAGMNDVLIKPVSRTKLAKVLALRHNNAATPQKTVKTTPPPIDLPTVVDAIPTAEVEWLDEELLANLIEDLGPEMAPRLLDNFISETDVAVEQFMSEPNPDDTQLIGEIHKLAGSSALFGTKAFSGLLRELETIGKTDDPAKMRDRLPELRERWESTRLELDELKQDMFAEE